MKVKLEFEIEVEPISNKILMDSLEDFSEETEYNLRHYIHDYCTNDDLDEIFVKYKVNKV